MLGAYAPLALCFELLLRRRFRRLAFMVVLHSLAVDLVSAIRA